MKNKILSSILLLLLIGCTKKNKNFKINNNKQGSSIENNEFQGFSLESHNKFHREFNKDIFANFWKGDEKALYNFLNLSEFWPHSTINRSGEITQLPLAINKEVSNFIIPTKKGNNISLSEIIKEKNNKIDGMLILHKGNIVFEEYSNMKPYDKHIWFSMTKVLASTAVAILEDRNQIDAKKPIDFYFPNLVGTAWEGIKVIDILDMCSGIDCYDIYGVKNTCFSDFMEAYGWPITSNAIDNPMDFFEKMQKVKPPGEVFEYGGVNTYMLSHLVEEIVQKKFTDFFEEEVWQPMGAESDAMMTVATNGKAGTAFGMNSNLRDLARFGLLFTPTGRQKHPNLISINHIRKIQKEGRPYLFDNSTFWKFSDDVSHNSYQWDYVMKDGDFYKIGSEGQGLYISNRLDLVIVYFGHSMKTFEIMPKIVRKLAVSELFNN